MVPYFNKSLQTLGYSDFVVSAAATTGAALRVVAPLMLGVVADVLGRRLWIFRYALLGGSICCFLLSGLSWSFWAMCAFPMYMVCVATAVPMADVAAHKAVAPKTERYARLRVAGSLGFALSAYIGTQIGLTQVPPLMFVASGLLLFVGVCFSFGLGDLLDSKVQRPNFQEAINSVHAVRLELFLLGAVGHFTGMGIYDAYFAIHIGELGLPDEFTGTSILVAVVTEVVLMLMLPVWVRKVGSEGARWLVLTGAVAAIIRWVVLATTTSPIYILLTQPLHALTFGLWFVGSVTHIQGRAPDNLRASLQTALASAAGLGGLIGTAVGGYFLTNYTSGHVFAFAASTAIATSSIYVLHASRSKYSAEAVVA